MTNLTTPLYSLAERTDRNQKELGSQLLPSSWLPRWKGQEMETDFTSSAFQTVITCFSHQTAQASSHRASQAMRRNANAPEKVRRIYEGKGDPAAAPLTASTKAPGWSKNIRCPASATV